MKKTVRFSRVKKKLATFFQKKGSLEFWLSFVQKKQRRLLKIIQAKLGKQPTQTATFCKIGYRVDIENCED